MNGVSWRHEYNLQVADTMSFPSVVFHGDDNALASIKVVSEAYPLRGAVRIADELFGEQRAVDGIPPAGEVWADGALLARVGADVGDMLDIGELQLKVAAVLTYRPDQSIGFASLAPTVIMNIADIGASGLIGEGSRVGYALLVAGDETDVAAFNEAIEDILPDEIRVTQPGRKQRAGLQRRGPRAALSVVDSRDQPAAQRGGCRHVGATFCDSPHGHGSAHEEPRRDPALRHHGVARAARAARRARRHRGQCRRFRGRRDTCRHPVGPPGRRSAGQRLASRRFSPAAAPWC